jgi:hypothetical protein
MGQENLSSSMSWILYCIADNEKLQATLAHEWAFPNEVPCTATSITNQVIKETKSAPDVTDSL